MISRISGLRTTTVLIVAIALPWSTAGCSEPDAQTLYNSYCLGCHGVNMDAGIGGSLVDSEWKYATTDAEMVALIKTGIPEKGMMPFEKILKEPQIQALVDLIRAQAQPAE